MNIEELASGGDSSTGAVGEATPTSGDFDFDTASAELSQGLFGDTTNAATTDDGTGIPDGGGVVGDDPAKPAEPAATAPTPPAASAVPPPKTWRPEALTKWDTLPAEVQQEVLKREEDMFKGIESYKGDADIGRTVQGILAPYMPILQQMNIDPMQQVQGLMQAHYVLATGSPEQKQMLFQKLAQDYGVNLGGDTPYVDPQVADLRQQLSALQSNLSNRERQEAESVRVKLSTEIDTFASDPAHPYFSEVASDIASLLRGKAAVTLAEAYEKAVWANPVTRAKEQARLATESEAKAKAEQAERVAAARKATGANVKSSAKAGSATATPGSMDDTLNETLAAIRNRA